MPISIIDGIGSSGINSGDGIGGSGISSASSGGAASLLVYDTFTDSGSKDIALHAPDVDNTGSGWTRLSDSSADFRIGDNPANTLQVFTAAVGEHCYITNAESPYIMQCERVNGGTIYMAIRIIDGSNYFRIKYDTNTSVNNFRIADVVSGTQTARATFSIGTSPILSAWVADDGNTISVGVEGGAAGGTYDSTTHNTSQNFGFTGIGTGYFTDNLLAYSGTTDPSDLVAP